MHSDVFGLFDTQPVKVITSSISNPNGLVFFIIFPYLLEVLARQPIYIYSLTSHLLNLL